MALILIMSETMGKHYSEYELSIVLILCEQYRYIIENKKTDSKASLENDNEWKFIAHTFNSR